MKRLILIFFFLIISTFSVYASNWEKFTETKSLKVYYDTQSFKVGTLYSYVNLLYDLKEPNVTSEGTVNSMTIYKQFNCKKEKFKILKQNFFETKMGKGKPFSSIGKGEWQPINGSGSLDGFTFRAACQIE